MTVRRATIRAARRRPRCPGGGAARRCRRRSSRIATASDDCRRAGRRYRRTHPTEGEPVDLAMLAEWVESLQVRYAAAGDWLRPCWWRHGFVVEELAALRMAWLGVYDTSEPVDATAGVRWHEEAEKCRERIRRTISAGPGCTAVSHKPDRIGPSPRSSARVSGVSSSVRRAPYRAGRGPRGQVEAVHAVSTSSRFGPRPQRRQSGPLIRLSLPNARRGRSLGAGEWVDSLLVLYAAAGDWFRPAGGVTVSSSRSGRLRAAWLAVYDASEPVDPTAGVRWHEEAERCRERIRRTISVGPGCSAVSHKPDEPVTEDSRWLKSWPPSRINPLVISKRKRSQPKPSRERPASVDPARGDL